MEDITTVTDANAEYKDAMNGLQRAVKRLVDIVAAFCGIVILSPVLLIVYIIIQCAGGEAIYKQERVGYKGKTFTIYKFRTMKKDAEKHGIPRTEAERLEQMTKVGRFLREHHLDELPQMFNVLNGDMTLVGPRPERKYFVDKIMEENPDYKYLYQLRPGLFSKATLYNGYTDTMEKMLERLRMDLEYLDTRTIWMDIDIIFRTVMSILTGKKF